ncbi:ribose 5-phosphate isomerase B [Patescibacteria group bacterium]|nr:ribose 5-phosphate isomerase B [Patescibacteria group bacterium]
MSLFEKDPVHIYIGADHAAYEAKGKLVEFLKGEGYGVTDLGTFSEASVDYPDVAREVGEKVLDNEGSFGVLICGTGLGMNMAVNKLRGIRAAQCKDVEDAEMARKHNNANVLTMGARTMSEQMHRDCALKFFTTSFEGDMEGFERHKRRVEKIDLK